MNANAVELGISVETLNDLNRVEFSCGMSSFQLSTRAHTSVKQAVKLKFPGQLRLHLALTDKTKRYRVPGAKVSRKESLLSAMR